jgi:chromosome segregation ATPase
MDDEFESRLKSARREFATEFEAVNANMSKLAKLLRDKSDVDDVSQIARKLADVETDSRDANKAVKAELHDLRQTMSRGMDAIAASVAALSESLSTFRREADGRTIDTVSRMLNDRKPPVSGPVWAAGGGAGAGLLSLIAYLVSHSLGQ